MRNTQSLRANLTNENQQKGFTLVELSIILIIAGMIMVLIALLIPKITERMRLDNTEVGIQSARNAMTGFVVTHDRLPCPDGDGDGREDCADNRQVGEVPYRDLGLAGPVVDTTRIPLRYAVYRRTDATLSDNANLALMAPANRYMPILPGDPPGDTPTVQSTVFSALDFCEAVANVIHSANSVNFIHTTRNGVNTNMAMLLVSGGVEDANGDSLDRALDGLNSDPGGVAAPTSTSFDSPGRLRGDNYDDIVRAVSAEELSGQLSCPRHRAGVNALAVSSVVMENLAVLADLTHQQAVLDVEMAEVQVALAAFAAVVQAANIAWTVSEAIESTGDACTSFGASVAIALAFTIISVVVEVVNGVLSVVEIALAAADLIDANADEADAAAALADSLTAATDALNRVLKADWQGGVH